MSFKPESLTDIYSSVLDRPIFSIEVIPPLVAEDTEKMKKTLQGLVPLHPRYISVTRRAEGTDEFTIDICRFIQQELGITAVPHITAVHHNEATFQELATKISQAGLKNILFVRGDTPDAQTAVVPPSAFDSVNPMLELSRAHMPEVCISVAAMPEGYPHDESPQKIANAVRILKMKEKLGARVALTQLFLCAEQWGIFLEECRRQQVSIPIIPGMMPITSLTRVKRMVTLTGLNLPQALAQMLPEFESNPKGLRGPGLKFSADFIRVLGKTAPGVHLFSFNNSADITELKALLDGFFA